MIHPYRQFLSKETQGYVDDLAEAGIDIQFVLDEVLRNCGMVGTCHSPEYALANQKAMAAIPNSFGCDYYPEAPGLPHG